MVSFCSRPKSKHKRNECIKPTKMKCSPSGALKVFRTITIAERRRSESPKGQQEHQQTRTTSEGESKKRQPIVTEEPKGRNKQKKSRKAGKRCEWQHTSVPVVWRVGRANEIEAPRKCKQPRLEAFFFLFRAISWDLMLLLLSEPNRAAWTWPTQHPLHRAPESRCAAASLLQGARSGAFLGRDPLHVSEARAKPRVRLHHQDMGPGQRLPEAALEQDVAVCGAVAST